MVLHDHGKPFCSPTVNLYIPPSEFVEMLTDLEHYVNGEIIDITQNNKFPIGLLEGKIHLYFMHYHTFEEAVKAWRRRSKRIDWNNLRVVLVEQGGCTHDDLLRFDSLDYKYKVALTHQVYSDISCGYVINGFKTRRITDYCNLLGRRYYDQFDWVKFLYN